jgi:hypothetical protein
VTVKLCKECSVELSPWEGARCVTHGLEPRDYAALSVADIAVASLEREGRTLTGYDIARVAERDHARELYLPSLFVTISNDWRFCWAGKGLYGLFRHRLVPGPRNLQGVGSLFVFAAGAPLTLEQLAFTMRWCGYRFADFSLLTALRNSAPIVARLRGVDSNDARGWTIATLDEVQMKSHLEIQRFAPNGHALDAMIDRCRGFIAAAEVERQRRVVDEASATVERATSEVDVDGNGAGPSTKVVASTRSYAPTGDLTRANYEATLTAARADGRPWLDGSRKPIAHILRRRGVTWRTNDERNALISTARGVIFGSERREDADDKGG